MFTHPVSELLADLNLAPLHLKVWLLYLSTVAVMLPLVMSPWVREARIVTLFQLGNAVLGTILGLTFGLVRLTGLAHVVFWTPAVVYLWGRRQHHPSKSTLGVWLRITLATMIISLVFDYVDVARYLLGDRERMAVSWSSGQ